jgi:glutamine amidotransferase
MRVAIIRYNGGNTVSVRNALRRLGVEPVVTDRVESIVQAEKVIIPGVGEASSAMRSLREAGLADIVRELAQPVLGICLGMQLLCTHSEEGDTECLGILPNNVRKFDASAVKVPHTGWNNVRHKSSPLFEGVRGDAFMYFVHSYFVEADEAALATTEHSVRFASAVSARNFHGVQFHPEKSGTEGARVLENFLRL